MAQPFAKILATVSIQNLNILEFLERNDISLLSFENKVSILNEEGDVEYIEKNNAVELYHKSGSFSFFVYLNDYSNFYVRVIKNNDIMTEEYDWGSADPEDHAKIKDIIQKRSFGLLQNGNLIGAVLDEAGYTEEFDWDSFIRHPDHVTFSDEPSFVILKKDLTIGTVTFKSLKMNDSLPEYFQFE